MYSYNGNSFVDSGIIYGSAISALRSSEADIVSANNLIFTDANNAPVNLVYALSEILTPNIISNLPVYNKGGIFYTLIYNTTESTGKIQYMHTNDNTIWYRINWNNSWRDWKKMEHLENIALQSSQLPLISESNLIWNDANNAEVNKVFGIAQTVTENVVKNLPVYLDAGILSTSCFDTSVSMGGILQTYFSQNKRFFYRIKWANSWNAWTEVNMLQRYFENACFVFSKFGVIGDSLASGYMTNTKTGAVIVRNLKCSWPKYLSLMLNNAVNIYAKHGFTCKSWFTDPQYGYVEYQADSKVELMIIGIGTNDDLTPGSTYVNGAGSISDINLENPALNGDSFYGYYGRLIQTVQNTQSNTIIVTLTVPYPRRNPQKNNIIKEVSEYLGVLCIDIANDYENIYKNIFITQTYYNNHFTATGYAILANVMKEILTDAINKNTAYFSNVGFITYN